MHPLLTRQIKRYLGERERLNLELQCFINAIEQSYRQFDEEAQFNERALELVSIELNERNARLRAQGNPPPSAGSEDALRDSVSAALRDLQRELAAPPSADRDEAMRATLAALAAGIEKPR